MVRMKNTVTGSFVNVTDEKAARLGSEWEPAEKPKRSAKKSEKSGD